jgi:hypothetical protein
LQKMCTIELLRKSKRNVTYLMCDSFANKVSFRAACARNLIRAIRDFSLCSK